MNSLLQKYNLNAGIFALIGLMLATRVHHFGSAFSLPDASLVVFFLGGLFFNRMPFFVFLLIEAALIDYVAITKFGVSDFCVSKAYIALIPTYGVMWLAGDYCKKYKTMTRSEMYAQFVILFLGTSMAFLISNGSFFLFSGRYADASFEVYLERVAKYYPPYVSATLLYGLVMGVGIKIVNALKAHHETSRNEMI
jgi:hypothetical protein